MSYPELEPRLCSWLLHQARDGEHCHLLTVTITSLIPLQSHQYHLLLLGYLHLHDWSSIITFLPAFSNISFSALLLTAHQEQSLASNPSPPILCPERYTRSLFKLARPRKNKQEFKLLPRYLGASWNLRLAGACKMCFVKLTLQLP